MQPHHPHRRTDRVTGGRFTAATRAIRAARSTGFTEDVMPGVTAA
jgi:hypothetical protein